MTVVESETHPSQVPEPAEYRPSRRKAWLALGAIVVVLALAVVAIVVLKESPSEASETSGTKQIPATATIQRKTLQEIVTSPGSLGYAGAGDLAAGMGGTVTALPSAGSQIASGSALYSVDNQPVTLLTGALPMWRAFQSGMTQGPDVQQLETSLAALGLFTRTPDTTFDGNTEAAIRTWQKKIGVPVTGAIPMGQIFFAAGDVRVGEVATTVGSLVGPGTVIAKISSLGRIVTAQLKADSQQVAVVGAKVSVQLPNGQTTPGTVAGIGAPTQLKENGGNSTIVPVSITLDDQAAAASFQEASVSVDFPTQAHPNVLSVPVTALIALPGGGYGVEVVGAKNTTKKIAVKTGVFVGGFVEVAGSAIQAGQKVVVPSL